MRLSKKISIIVFLVIIIILYLYKDKMMGLFYSDVVSTCSAYNAANVYKYVDVINKNKTNYSSTTVDIFGRSSQGGEQTDYTDSNGITLSMTSFFGETGKREIDFYRKDNIIFYVRSTSTKYVGSIYDEGDLLIKSVDTDTYILDKSGNMCKWERNTIDQKITNEERDTIKSFILKL